MKKIVSLLLLLLSFGLQLIAGPVDAKRAKAFAEQFVQVNDEDFRAATVKEAQAPAYYIFNDKTGKGFVLVSGEDRLPLLMAYADEGQIDAKKLPIQLKALLERYSEQVKALRQTKDKDNLRSQDFYIHKAQIIVKPLTQSKWDQAEPFNNDAPKMSDGQKAMTGCVATAMAQIMYYHKWPKQGQGSHAYTPIIYGKKLSVNFSKSNYKWEDMRDRYPIRYTQNQWTGVTTKERGYLDSEAKAIAKLMFDLGVAVDMNFNTGANGGSSAITYYAAKSMTKYFKYNAKYIARINCKGSQFIDKMKSELDSSRPFILSGAKDMSGHAWVVDGYDENDYMHCNWGWSGIANGFYSINMLVPVEKGIGAGFGKYNDAQDIIIAKPNKNGKQEVEPASLSCQQNGRLAWNESSMLKTQDLSLKLTNPGNNGSTQNFTGQLGVGVFDKNDNLIKKTIWVQDVNLPEFYAYPSVSLFLNLKNLSAGTYSLRPISKYLNKEWIVFKDANEIVIEISGNIVRKVSDSYELAFQHSLPPREEAQAYNKGKGSCYLRIKNKSCQIIKEAKLYMYLSNKDKKHKLFLDDVRFYSLEDRSYKMTYDLSTLRNLKAGTYDVSFEIKYERQSYPIKNPFGKYSITILDQNDLAVLTCKSMEVNKGDYPLESYHLTEESLKGEQILNLIAIVENKGDIAYKGRFSYRLKKISNGKIIELGQSQEIELKAGSETPSNKMYTEFDLSKLKLQKGLYELHLVANHEGKDLDVWNPLLKRHIFVYKGYDAKPTAIEKLRGLKIKVYPNPVINELHIEGAYQSLSLYSMTGQRLIYYSEQEPKPKILDTSSIPRGSYILRLKTAEGQQSLHIYKQ